MIGQFNMKAAEHQRTVKKANRLPYFIGAKDGISVDCFKKKCNNNCNLQQTKSRHTCLVPHAAPRYVPPRAWLESPAAHAHSQHCVPSCSSRARNSESSWQRIRAWGLIGMSRQVVICAVTCKHLQKQF